jgi:hypothetical protein
MWRPEPALPPIAAAFASLPLIDAEWARRRRMIPTPSSDDVGSGPQLGALVTLRPRPDAQPEGQLVDDSADHCVEICDLVVQFEVDGRGI